MIYIYTHTLPLTSLLNLIFIFKFWYQIFLIQPEDQLKDSRHNRGKERKSLSINFVFKNELIESEKESSWFFFF